MPKPEKHVFVCTQQRPTGHPRSSCGEKNCVAVVEEFLWQVQQKELSERIQVTATGCMGPCSEGPTVLVYPEGVMYGGVSKEDVNTIIDEHLVGDKPVEPLLMAAEFWS
ncbi:MAG: (2Fe-2S) ferredoxin domain-containing protein [Gammaproteobacteria bacterium]